MPVFQLYPKQQSDDDQDTNSNVHFLTEETKRNIFEKIERQCAPLITSRVGKSTYNEGRYSSTCDKAHSLDIFVFAKVEL